MRLPWRRVRADARRPRIERGARTCPQPHSRPRPSRSSAPTRRACTPVVFIHGLWLLPSSWDRWATVFEEAGYTALTPGWPDDPETVEEANAHPEVFAHKTVGAGRRPLRRGDRQARQEAGRDRALLRRPADADPRRARPLGGVGGDRPGAVPRRAAAADLGAQVGVAGARQPGQPQPRGPAHLRAVPLRLRQRRERGRGQGAVRDVRRAGAGRAALPGRDRQPQPVDRGEGRHARTPSAARC